MSADTKAAAAGASKPVEVKTKGTKTRVPQLEMPMLTSVPFEVADTAEEKMDWDRETAGTEAEAEESMSIGDASGSAEAAAGGASRTSNTSH